MNSTIEINSGELETIVNLAHTLCISPSDLFCKEAKRLSEYVPPRVKVQLLDFVKSGSPTGFLLLTGILNTDDSLGPTPPTNTHKIGEGTILAKIQAILTHVIGEMIAYEAEGYGRLFQDVIPDKSMAIHQTSISSDFELEIHTEQAFSRLRPDFLSLACLRGDLDAITYILPVQYILEHLSEGEILLLQQPLWYTGVDLSFKRFGGEFIDGDVRGPMPILYPDPEESGGKLHLVFDQDLMWGVDETADELIAKIVDIYYQHRISHNLCPGEIIFVDNRFAVHGRSPFFPKYDGKDRFLIRCFATLHYERYEVALTTRTLGERTVRAIYS
jgi:L-asparagine oxygenase